jgi:DNA ligase-1
MTGFMLAEDWRKGINPAGWLMSEKLDGVRAMWDGEKLITRGGRTINAPEWWTEKLPAIVIDGELWAGRGRFEFVSAAQRRNVPTDSEWREIVFMVFDAPGAAGGFSDRLAALSILPESGSFQIVGHRPCASERDLKNEFRRVVKAAGEGVILRRPESAYSGERSFDFLKVKPIDNAKATVTGYTPGKGKHTGRVGAIICRTAAGIIFKVGTGLSEDLRERPPRIGREISYQFRGLTRYGVPRHAALVG